MKLNNKRGRWRYEVFYMLLVWAIIGLATCKAQAYLVTATGELTSLDNISQINNMPVTKYYTVKSFYINKNFAHFKDTSYVTDVQKSLRYVMFNYISVPLFNHHFPDTTQIAKTRDSVNAGTLVIINDSVSTMQHLKKLSGDSIFYIKYLSPDAVKTDYGTSGKYGALTVTTYSYKKNTVLPPLKIAPTAWLCIKFSKYLYDDPPYKQQEDSSAQFAKDNYANFYNIPLGEFEYLDRIPYNSEDMLGYTEAIKSENDVTGGPPIILCPVHEKFADRNGNNLQWVFWTLIIGCVLFVISLTFAPLKSYEGA